jgi:hypothetical protein
LSLFEQACPRRGDASLPRLARALFPRPSDRGILGRHAAQLWSAILRDLRQGTSRIRPSPAYLPRSSPRTSRLFLRSAVHLVSSSSRGLRRCRNCARAVVPRHVASRSNRPTDRVEWLEFAPLVARIVLECTAALRGNKACQGEVVQSNIGEAGNRTTAAVARPAIPPRGPRDWRTLQHRARLSLPDAGR